MRICSWYTECMHRRSWLILAGMLVAILIISYALFQISKSRTFQFFGEVIARVETDKKVVALTFDDGPTEYTTQVLKTLQEEEVEATFFVNGQGLKDNPEIGKEIVSQGHELGNHTYSHDRMMFKSPSFIDKEISTTTDLMKKAGYTGEIYFRPPYGKKLFLLPWYLEQHNMKTIMWDVEPDSYGSTKEFLVSYTLKHTKPGSIILLHPNCASCTGQREAIGEIIDTLHSEGYTFVTVSELLKSKK